MWKKKFMLKQACILSLALLTMLISYFIGRKVGLLSDYTLILIFVGVVAFVVAVSVIYEIIFVAVKEIGFWKVFWFLLLFCLFTGLGFYYYLITIVSFVIGIVIFYPLFVVAFIEEKQIVE